MEFLLIATAHFAALLSPGPDFFLILQASLRLPFRYRLALSAGIALANAVYLLVAVLGVELLRSLDGLVHILRFVGAGYLLFLGVMLLKAPRRDLTADDRDDGGIHGRSIRRQLLIGFGSAILNPKNAIFYLTLFTVMIAPETPLPVRGAYALWMASIVFLWDTLLSSLFGLKAVVRRLGEGVFYVEKGAGVVLTCFAVLLPFG